MLYVMVLIGVAGICACDRDDVGRDGGGDALEIAQAADADVDDNATDVAEDAVDAADDLTPACGNGVVDLGEECDDGRNGGEMDGCTQECTFSCHAATQWTDCRDRTDDCITMRCVSGGFGQICERENFVGECLYSGCTSGTLGHGTCADGVCVCRGGDHDRE